DDKGWDARKRAYCLKIQPATGSFARNLIYSTKPTGDRPVLVLRIIQLEAVQEEMANEFRDLLVEKFKDSKVETFIGTFTA
ncbi:DUF2303 family protein, partial [Escherichia coli]